MKRPKTDRQVARALARDRALERRDAAVAEWLDRYGHLVPLVRTMTYWEEHQLPRAMLHRNEVHGRAYVLHGKTSFQAAQYPQSLQAEPRRGPRHRGYSTLGLGSLSTSYYQPVGSKAHQGPRP